MIKWILGMYFISFFLLFFVLMLKRSGIRKFFGRQVEKYIRFTKDDDEPDISLRQVLLKLIDAVAALIVGKSFSGKLQVLIDKAAVPLRASEFVFFHGIAVVLAVLLGYTLGGIAGVILMIAIAVSSPILGLVYMRRQRDNKFHEQLPDTLSLIAGALKAGYSFLQAVDMTVKETAPPMSVEFKKVLTEARLGLPLEQALENMAKRVESNSFDWTVMAVKIQREVGGNLAEILEILSDTIRERDRVQRQIKVLTAEGRLSAIILFLLPFAVGVVLWVLNPGYLALLFNHPLGLMMAGMAVVMLAVGGLWLKKVVTIEV